MGAGLSQVEEGVDQAAEVFEFIAGEVVDVIWQDLAVGAACPSGQAHVGLVGGAAGGDEFGGGVAVEGVVELVLDGGEEALGSGASLLYSMLRITWCEPSDRTIRNFRIVVSHTALRRNFQEMGVGV